MIYALFIFISHHHIVDARVVQAVMEIMRQNDCPDNSRSIICQCVIMLMVSATDMKTNEYTV